VTRVTGPRRAGTIPRSRVRNPLGPTAVLVVLCASASAAAQSRTPGGPAGSPLALVPIIRDYDGALDADGRRVGASPVLPTLRLITMYDDSGAAAGACGCTVLPAVAIGPVVDETTTVRRLMLFTSYDGDRLRGPEAAGPPRLAIVRDYDGPAATTAVVVLPVMAIAPGAAASRLDGAPGRGAVELPPVAVVAGPSDLRR
jgi:hypothetical protein